MYALDGFDLGARRKRATTVEALQEKIALAQSRIASLQTKLSHTIKLKEKHKIESSIIEQQKRLTDYQLQLAQLQAGIPPPSTPTTPTPTTPSTPSTPTTPSTTWMSQPPYILDPSDYVQPAPTQPAPTQTATNLFSNPWVLGGIVAILFLLKR